MCTRPIFIKNPDPHKFLGPSLQVPCGHCCECLKSRQDSWKLRLMEEADNWANLFFFTLTYNDDALPVTDDGLSTACKRDIQLWLKKFRMSYRRLFDCDFQGKYFICAEYGPNGTHRPHYHGLLMTDCPKQVVDSLFADWRDRKGFVDVSMIDAVQGERQAVANYVSKYCCKGEFASRRDDIAAGLIEKAWTVCSKGIGSTYPVRMRSYHIPFPRKFVVSVDEADCVLDRQKVCFRTETMNYKYRMPRYYKERLYHEKMPFEVDVWDKKQMKYVKKIVYRYCTKNLLARQLQVRVRDIFLEKILKFEQDSGLDKLFFTDIETYCRVTCPPHNNMVMREHKARRNLFSFYETNSRKWSHL